MIGERDSCRRIYIYIISVCVCHCLDLFLEDIGKFSWCEDVIEQTDKLVKFIQNHDTMLSKFRNKNNMELVQPGKTRFATNFIMMRRVMTYE